LAAVPLEPGSSDDPLAVFLAGALPTVYHEFLRCAAAVPRRSALRDGRWRCRYARLAAWSQSLGAELQRQGAATDRPVAVWCDSPRNAIPGILGAMAAGAAYLPLDPSLPERRMARIVADAGCTHVLVSAASADRAAAAGLIPVLIDQKSARRGRKRAGSGPSPGDLAYLLYTSGSTGEPKGVEVTHANLSYSNAARIQYYGPARRFLLLSPLWFDSSVAGLFWTLASGGTLVLTAGDRPSGWADLPGLIARERISTLLCIPAVWNSVLEQWQGARYAEPWALHQVIVAGETCPELLVSKHFRQLPDVRLFNEYGPTEATVWCTVHECSPGERGPIPIGQPLRGARAYVLDETGTAVQGPGQGELCIAGPGVARGYRNSPELTSARFVAEPDNARSAMYRTGDLVRRRADGALEYVGRVDHQVKVNGRRIELGDIEAALSSHSLVSDVAVVYVPSNGAPGRLSAWVAPRAGADLDLGELRQYLADRLPAYMAPGEWRVCAELPRNANGKLDRRALVEQSHPTEASSPDTVPMTAAEATPVRDGLQSQLLCLAKAVLGRDVGVDEDLFLAGADSLGALDLAMGVERRWGTVVSPDRLLELGSVAKLAAYLRASQTEQSWSPLVSLTSGSKPPLFLAHPGGGNVSCYRELSRLLDDRPVFGLQHRGACAERLEGNRETVESLAAEYLAAVMKEQPTGVLHFGGWSFGGLVAYEMACQAVRQGREVGLVAVIDSGILHAVAVLRTVFSDMALPLYQLEWLDRETIFKDFLPGAIRAGILPQGVEPAQARRILDVFLDNLHATLEYRPTTYPGAVDLLLGSEPLVKVKSRPEREWRQWTEALRVHAVEGHHLNLLQSPQAASLAAVLEQRLAEIERGDGPHTQA
jgi:amino acid adenylation domain-containing protein